MIADELSFIKSLLLEALQQTPEERERFISNHPDASASQKDEVLALLRARSQSPALLDDNIPSLIPSPQCVFDRDLLSAGDILADRYRIEYLLARTLHSQVFLASDLRLAGNQVVVKLVRTKSGGQPDIHDQLWSEINALARLRHPGVTGLIDTGVLSGAISFLVLQYCPGPTLQEWIESRQPTLKARCMVYRQLLSITAAIHDAGLLHLDLKPQNIIVNDNDEGAPAVIILDFGISHLQDSLSGDSIHAGGTNSFAAPERARGIAGVASDIYSLGRIAQFLCPTPPPQFKPWLDKALNEDPKRRFSSAREFLNRFEEAIRQPHPNPGFLIPAAAVAFLFVSFAIWLPVLNKTPLAPPAFHSITSMRGIESDVAFAPDGETIYFSHGETESGRISIYKTTFSGSEPKLFLEAPENHRFLATAVSPDNRNILFLDYKTSEPTRIWAVSPDGSNLRTVYQGRAGSLSFGRHPHLVYITLHHADQPGGRAAMLNLTTGELTYFEAPPQGHIGDIDSAVSPDGRTLAFIRFRFQEASEIYIVPLDESGKAAGPPRAITSLDRRIRHLLWLRDNRSLLFNAGSLTVFSPWIARFAGPPGSAKVTVEALQGWREHLERSASSITTNRLAYIQWKEDTDIYRLSLKPGKPNRLEPLITSTSLDEEPRFSPDGKYISFFSQRFGSLQGWMVANKPGATPERKTSFERAEKAWTAFASPESAFFFARIPVLGPELQRLDGFSQSSSPRRVFTSRHSDRIVGLSVDGNSVFADVSTSTEPRLERWSLITDRKESLAPVQARFVKEFYRRGKSGEQIQLFADSGQTNALFVIERGKARKLYPSLRPRNTFTYLDGYAYLASQQPSPGIYKVDVATGQSTLLHPLEKSAGWGMDISPDGSQLIIALSDFEDADIIGATWPEPAKSPLSRLQDLFNPGSH